MSREEASRWHWPRHRQRRSRLPDINEDASNAYPPASGDPNHYYAQQDAAAHHPALSGPDYYYTPQGVAVPYQSQDPAADHHAYHHYWSQFLHSTPQGDPATYQLEEPAADHHAHYDASQFLHSIPHPHLSWPYHQQPLSEPHDYEEQPQKRNHREYRPREHRSHEHRPREERRHSHGPVSPSDSLSQASEVYRQHSDERRARHRSPSRVAQPSVVHTLMDHYKLLDKWAGERSLTFAVVEWGHGMRYVDKRDVPRALSYVDLLWIDSDDCWRDWGRANKEINQSTGIDLSTRTRRPNEGSEQRGCERAKEAYERNDPGCIIWSGPYEAMMILAAKKPRHWEDQQGRARGRE